MYCISTRHLCSIIMIQQRVFFQPVICLLVCAKLECVTKTISVFVRRLFYVCLLLILRRKKGKQLLPIYDRMEFQFTWRAGGLQGKSGKRGIPVPELKSDGKSDCQISLMPLHVKTAERCRHLCKYFKRLWFESLVGKAEAALRGQPDLNSL